MAFTANQLQDAFAIAVEHINKDIPDVMTKANFFLHKIFQNKKYVSGGRQFQLPLNHVELQSQGFINGTTDTVSTNPQQTFTFGTLDWKYHYDTVSVTLDDLTKTEDSKEALISLMKGKVAAAKGSVARDLSTAAHTSGTASNKGFNGLPDIFAASGTAYAGLTDTDFTNGDEWLTELDSTVQAVTYANLSKMVGTIRGRTQGIYNQEGKPYRLDTAFSNSAVQEEFINSEQIKARYVDQKTLEAGFDVVKFRNMDWGIDEFSSGSADGSTADNFLYLVTSNSMGFFYKYGFDKKAPVSQDQAILPNQPLLFNVNYLAGNIYCENRRVNGLFKTLIA